MTTKQIDKLNLGPGESVVLDVFLVYIMINKSNERHYFVVHDGQLSYIDRSYTDFCTEKQDPVCIREYTRLADARRMVTKFKKEFENRTDGVILGIGIEKRGLMLKANSIAYKGTNIPVNVNEEVLDITDMEYSALN